MSGATARLTEFRLALMLLTRLPAGRMADPVPDLACARWAFPLVGLPVAVIVWAVHAGAMSFGAGPAMAAVMALGALILVTGGLHHDGLADFADGIGGGRDRAHCLEIMRDSRIGSYGVLALIVTLGLWGTALTRLGPLAGLAAFLAVGVASRFAMVVLLYLLPPARGYGLGAQAGGRASGAVIVGAAATVLAVLPLGRPALPVAVAMALGAGFVAWQARRRIGGQTGDVLGAAQMLSETAGWAALALIHG
jgi:adenosylcobinamide-GDP ribazoletransferase